MQHHIIKMFTSKNIKNNDVVRTLKKLGTSKGDYWIKQGFSSIASLFKMGTSLKGKNLLPELPLRAVPYGMENPFYHIRCPPLNVTIFLPYVRNCIMRAF